MTKNTLALKINVRQDTLKKSIKKNIFLKELLWQLSITLNGSEEIHDKIKRLYNQFITCYIFFYQDSI